jgi:hypothetical protein
VQTVLYSYQFALMQKVEMSLLGMVARRGRKGIVLLTVVEPYMDESQVVRGHCQVSLEQ